MSADPIIEARQVSKVYTRAGSDLRAVDDVSLVVERGDAIGIVGESGSGKSTLSRMLVGLERPTAGEVLLRGAPIGSLGRAALRRSVQIVFQDPYGSLNRRRRVADIIATPMRAQGMSRADALEQVPRLLELVGLSPALMTRFPVELSGGQCQRVGIARSLSVDPDFVVFDESVSAVDASARAQLMNLIRRLRDELGLTYVFVTHDLAVVRYMTTRIAVMQRGRIIEEAPRDQLLGDPQHEYSRSLIAAVPRLAKAEIA